MNSGGNTFPDKMEEDISVSQTGRRVQKTEIFWDIAGKSMSGLKAQLAQNLKASFQ